VTWVWDHLAQPQLRFVLGGPPGTAVGVRYLLLNCER
jgi:hypothetical protein